MISKLWSISFSLAGSTERFTCSWMGWPESAAARAPGPAPDSSAFKQVLRFIVASFTFDRRQHITSRPALVSTGHCQPPLICFFPRNRIQNQSDDTKLDLDAARAVLPGIGPGT